MSAAAEDFRPLVEGGGGGGVHDEVLLLQAKVAHSSGWVVVARSEEDLPGDGVGEALFFQPPDMGGESGCIYVFGFVCVLAYFCICVCVFARHDTALIRHACGSFRSQHFSIPGYVSLRTVCLNASKKKVKSFWS